MFAEIYSMRVEVKVMLDGAGSVPKDHQHELHKHIFEKMCAGDPELCAQYKSHNIPRMYTYTFMKGTVGKETGNVDLGNFETGFVLSGADRAVEAYAKGVVEDRSFATGKVTGTISTVNVLNKTYGCQYRTTTPVLIRTRIGDRRVHLSPRDNLSMFESKLNESFQVKTGLSGMKITKVVGRSVVDYKGAKISAWHLELEMPPALGELACTVGIGAMCSSGFGSLTTKTRGT
jgi:CRISPR/Cas system endoribonuclease Cas6 (RAMP superfamily)